MSNKLHKLRIVFSVVCGIVCLLLVVMWVRVQPTVGTRKASAATKK
jgi:hypothetical protein